MTLREAAQALLGRLDGSNFERWPEAMALKAQLAQPPEPDRWTAGAEAMREAAIQRAEAEEECPGEIPYSLLQKTLRDPAAALRAAVRSTKIGIVDGICALPVPPATTAPEAPEPEPVSGADELDPTLYRAPPARDVLTTPTPPRDATELPGSHKVWCATLYGSGTGPCNCGVRAPEAKPAESEVRWMHPAWRHPAVRVASVHSEPTPGYERVRVTVEPAPVEPEETP